MISYFHVHHVYCFDRERVIIARLSFPATYFYRRSAIKKQAIVFETFLYKHAVCIEKYRDLNTLECRLLRLAREMLRRRYDKLFVMFDMRDGMAVPLV